MRLNQVAPYPELEENSEAEEIGGPADGSQGVYPPFSGKLKRNSVKPIISNRVNASINMKKKKKSAHIYGLEMNASASQKMLESIVRSIETPKNQQEEIKLNLNKVNEEYEKP